MFDRAAQLLSIPAGVLGVLLALFSALAVGSVVRLVLLRHESEEKRGEHRASLRTWWVLTLLFTVALLGGRHIMLVMLAVTSLLGLQEMLALALADNGQRVRLLPYAAVPVHYVLCGIGHRGAIWMFIPIVMLLLIPARLLTTEHPRGYLRRVAVTQWSLMILVFCLSHLGFFYLQPRVPNPVGGPAGWILFLVLLTELNDISQALWGRAFGRRKITPAVSPHKSWEGFLLGMITTVLAAVVLAPWLTPLWSGSPHRIAGISLEIPVAWAVASGLLISVGGFFGDINLSGCKRDVDVKDSGNLLPGQGGVLDRIDSLTFTAPLFYYFVHFLYPPA